MNRQRFEEWKSRLNCLRVQMSDAEVDFWAAVMDFENDKEAWGRNGGVGYLYFEEALHVAGIKSPHEYRKFRACVEKLGGVESVKRIGLAAAKELLDVPDSAVSRLDSGKQAVRAAYDSLVEFRDRNGKEPAGQTAMAHVREHYVPEPKEKPAESENAFDKLKRENVELRAENGRLRKENANLRKQLASAGVVEKAQGPLASREPKQKRSKQAMATA